MLPEVTCPERLNTLKRLFEGGFFLVGDGTAEGLNSQIKVIKVSSRGFPAGNGSPKQSTFILEG